VLVSFNDRGKETFLHTKVLPNYAQLKFLQDFIDVLISKTLHFNVVRQTLTTVVQNSNSVLYRTWWEGKSATIQRKEKWLTLNTKFTQLNEKEIAPGISEEKNDYTLNTKFEFECICESANHVFIQNITVIIQLSNI